MIVVADFVDAVVTSGDFPLLSGVTLRIEGPSLTVLTGANGAGKTSLLRLLAGMTSVTSGEANVLGIDLVAGDRRQVRRRAGWLGHEGSFYDDLSVTENLNFAARALDRPLEDVATSLERVGLSNRSGALTKSLSAGQRRRMAIAWMVLRRPELWLLDEPYASLDARGRVLLSSLIGEAIAAGATVVVTSHDPLIVDTPSRMVELRGGRVSSSAE